MQRWTAVLFAALMAAALALVVMKGGGRAKPAPQIADAGVDAATSEPGTDAGTTSSDAGPDPLDPPIAPTPGVDAGGTLLLSGEPPPELPADAPKEVTWGVILVQYRGAQGALTAPGNTRSRDEALALARQLAADAKTDFK